MISNIINLALFVLKQFLAITKLKVQSRILAFVKSTIFIALKVRNIRILIIKFNVECSKDIRYRSIITKLNILYN